MRVLNKSGNDENGNGSRAPLEPEVDPERDPGPPNPHNTPEHGTQKITEKVVAEVAPPEIDQNQTSPDKKNQELSDEKTTVEKGNENVGKIQHLKGPEVTETEPETMAESLGKKAVVVIETVFLEQHYQNDGQRCVSSYF